MTIQRCFTFAAAAVPLLCQAALSQTGTCSGMTVGQLTSLNGFVPFPSDNLWNTDVSTAPVDPNSTNYVNFIGIDSNPPSRFRFGHVSQPNDRYSVSSGRAGTQAKVPVTVNAYPTESDPGPEPIPSNALIEGYPNPPSSGDRHVLVLEKDGCWLYELYHASLSLFSIARCQTRRRDHDQVG